MEKLILQLIELLDTSNQQFLISSETIDLKAICEELTKRGIITTDIYTQIESIVLE